MTCDTAASQRSSTIQHRDAIRSDTTEFTFTLPTHNNETLSIVHFQGVVCAGDTTETKHVMIGETE